MSANGNNNDNDNNTIFTIKDTKLYVQVATLSSRKNQKLSKHRSKGFERLIYWNEYQAKSENKNTANKDRYSPELKFIGVSRLFVLVYSNQNNDSKIFKPERYYLTKAVVDS